MGGWMEGWDNVALLQQSKIILIIKKKHITNIHINIFAFTSSATTLKHNNTITPFFV